MFRFQGSAGPQSWNARLCQPDACFLYSYVKKRIFNPTRVSCYGGPWVFRILAHRDADVKLNHTSTTYYASAFLLLAPRHTSKPGMAEVL